MIIILKKNYKKILNTKIENGIPVSTSNINLKKLSEYGYVVEWKNIKKDDGFTTIQNYLKNPAVKIEFGVDSSKLPYNSSDMKSKGHSLACINAFIGENGKKYVTVEDGAQLDFDPTAYGIGNIGSDDKNDGMKRIILWEDLFKSLSSIYENGNVVYQDSSKSIKAIVVISCQSAKQKTVTNHTVTPVVSAGTFDPLNHEYKFDTDTIKEKFKEIIRQTYGPLDECSVKVKDTKGQEYKVSGRWIYAMAEALCDSYHSNNRSYEKGIITVNKDSYTKWYYDNWINCNFHCYNENSKKDDPQGFKVYVAEGLKKLGIIKMPYDIQINGGEYIWDTIMNNQDGTLKKFKVKFTKENLKKYLHNWTSIGILTSGGENIYDNSIRKYLTKIVDEYNDNAILVEYSADEDKIWRIWGINTATPRHDGELPLWYDNFNTYKNWNDQFNEKDRGLTIISYLSKEELEKIK
ncbi:hypothetical protein [Methanosphaera cuniculi]|uniref:Uncharacterized protein n=1 Tax=Methanosphaera cuniculi TaxID=1077256 RepID=A0A2A2HE39_9EURY|nr:hypothetical protein [Methanosphaera cuniculi]PAV07625.1 hypothetical protein ASJ82_08085 [Methanosphaera cuniculi]PWL08051.1 hypothetical protein MSCUN_09820 [Methanosphaera cuniculi]